MNLPDNLSDVTAEQFRQLYWAEGLTMREIGEKFGKSVSSVQHYMDKRGVDRDSDYHPTGEDHPNYNSVEVTCDTCGEKFTRPEERQERVEGTYCDSECYGQSHGEGKVQCECEYCGETFERYAGNIKGKTFCDTECHNKWQAKEGPKGEDSPAWKGGPVTRTCYNCGEEFTRKRSHSDRGEHSFCSQQCAAIIHEKNEFRRNGRKITQTHRWRKIREKAIKRDNGRCQICGGDSNLHVHHMKPMKDGGEPFDMNNLVTVCESCHYSAVHENGTKEVAL